MATDRKARQGRLAKGDVRYLALEGGGGKGFAFVGALQALASPLEILSYASAPASPHMVQYKPSWLPSNVDQTRRLTGQVRGVAGASAGAITAFLLSCGYSPDEIVAIMDSYEFNDFFEPPTPRMVPTLNLDFTSIDPTGGEVRTAETAKESNSSVAFKLAAVAAIATAICPQGVAMGALSGVAAAQIWKKLIAVAPGLLQLYATLTGTSGLHPIQMLLRHLPQYLEFLPLDLGLFPGWQARRFFAEALAAKLPSATGTPNFNATFRSHFDFFGIKLAVTGTNLETGKSELFSVDTTPFFPVADAVRISMGLPLVYKPLVIRKEELGNILPKWVAGVWVDGGYLNNLPIAAFDADKQATESADTLGLRLEEDTRVDIATFGDLLKVWPTGMGFMGVGESGISESWGHESRTIRLATPGLSLLNFKPDPKARQEAVSLAHQKILEYFDAEHVSMESQPVNVRR